MFKFFFGLILLLSFKAHAACPAIDLLNESWPKLAQNQSENMCFASIASDLISSELKTRASIVAIANHTERSRDSFYEKQRSFFYGILQGYYRFHYFGGILSDAMTVNLKTGLCAFSFLDTYPVATVFPDLEKIREEQPQHLLAALKVNFDLVAPSFAEKLFKLSSKSAPLIDLAIDVSCIPLKQEQKIIVRHQDLLPYSLQQASTKIDLVLSAGHAVGVGYDFRVMIKDQTAMRERAGHASSLFGQSWNEEKKQCEYLIRFTDQKTCEYVSKPYACKNGIVSIPKRELIESTSDITWLETSK